MKMHSTSDFDMLAHVSAKGVHRESAGPINGLISHRCLEEAGSQGPKIEA